MAWAGDFGGSMTLTRDDAAAADRLLDLAAAQRDHRARAAQRRGGLVSVEVVEIAHDMAALEVITKHPHGTGFGFEGRFVVDANSETYTVQIVGDEAMTGARESIVSALRLELGEIDLLAMMAGPVDPATGGRAVPGMKLDPYDSAYDAQATYSASDDPRIDDVFPKHPLSFIRATFQRARSTWECASAGAHPDSPRSILLSSGPKTILSDNAVRELHQRALEPPETATRNSVTDQASHSRRFDPRVFIWPTAFFGLMAIGRGLTEQDRGTVLIGAGLLVVPLTIHVLWRRHT